MNQIYLNRKERVVLTAIEIIDELGIQGLSSKEIAKRQGISEGTLFRHFASKNDIVSAVLDYFSQFDSDIFNTILTKKVNFKESVLYFFQLYSEYYTNYPAITSIVNSYEVFRWDAEIESKIKSITKGRYNFIDILAMEGKRRSEFTSNIKSEAVADVVMGTFNSITLQWRMESHGFSLKDRMNSTIEIVVDALLALKN